MLEEMVARQPPSAGSRPVAIGSRSIAVSLQPAIPRRVAPQQSPLPLHRSPTIVAQSRSGEAVKCAAQPHCKDAVQRFAVTALSRRAHPPPMGCHLYFARRVTFLSCADIGMSGNFHYDTSKERLRRGREHSAVLRWAGTHPKQNWARCKWFRLGT